MFWSREFQVLTYVHKHTTCAHVSWCPHDLQQLWPEFATKTLASQASICACVCEREREREREICTHTYTWYYAQVMIITGKLQGVCAQAMLLLCMHTYTRKYTLSVRCGHHRQTNDCAPGRSLCQNLAGSYNCTCTKDLVTNGVAKGDGTYCRIKGENGTYAPTSTTWEACPKGAYVCVCVCAYAAHTAELFLKGGHGIFYLTATTLCLHQVCISAICVSYIHTYIHTIHEHINTHKGIHQQNVYLCSHRHRECMRTCTHTYSQVMSSNMLRFWVYMLYPYMHAYMHTHNWNIHI